MSKRRDEKRRDFDLEEVMCGFEWHLAKAVSNRKKHKVSFEEASTVFKGISSESRPQTGGIATMNHAILVLDVLSRDVF